MTINRMLAAVLALAVIVIVAMLLQQSAGLQRTAERIRDGAISVGDTFSVNYVTGRFHEIHSFVLGLPCASCHDKAARRSELFFMWRPEYLELGQSDRTSCLSCHNTTGVATPWYTGAANQ